MEICAQEYLRTVLSKINLRSEKKTEIIFKKPILTNAEKEKKLKGKLKSTSWDHCVLHQQKSWTERRETNKLEFNAVNHENRREDITKDLSD